VSFIAACGLVVSLSILPVSCARAAGVLVELGGGFGEFSVRSQGTAASLNSAVTVERKVEGKWVRMDVTNLYLRSACDGSTPPRCQRLDANATLKAAPWTGRFCSSQCPSSCRLDGPAPPGTYRFVITTCDGKETFVSAEFEKK
jgi:hypothetical protein